MLRLLLVTLATMLLAACGDFETLTETRVRLVNATSGGFDELDLYVDGDRRITGVAVGDVSSYTGLDADTYSIALARTGSVTLLATTTQTLEEDVDYTHVAYGTQGSLRAVLLAGDESEPDSGRIKLRVLNGATDAGAVDVYLTAPEDPLDDATPVAADVAADSTSDYVTLNRADYRIRVTAAGDRDDVRLDTGAAAVRFDSRQVSTLVVSGTTGGVLVNGALVVQDGGVQSFPNPYARVRVVAALATGAQVGVQAGGQTLLAAQPSPVVGAYTLLPAGTPTMTVTVNGVALPASTLDAPAGADLSVLVYGRPIAPQVKVLADDNRLPSGSGNAKIRLLHAVAGLDETMTLSVAFTPRASAGYGEASAPAQLSAGSNLRLEVTSPTPPTTKYLLDDVTLDAQGVYTVFMLGSFDNPLLTLAASLRKDH